MQQYTFLISSLDTENQERILGELEDWLFDNNHKVLTIRKTAIQIAKQKYSDYQYTLPKIGHFESFLHGNGYNLILPLYRDDIHALKEYKRILPNATFVFLGSEFRSLLAKDSINNNHIKRKLESGIDFPRDKLDVTSVVNLSSISQGIFLDQDDQEWDDIILEFHSKLTKLFMGDTHGEK